MKRKITISVDVAVLDLLEESTCLYPDACDNRGQAQWLKRLGFQEAIIALARYRQETGDFPSAFRLKVEETRSFASTKLRAQAERLNDSIEAALQAATKAAEEIV